jgi:branched-chain amino acid transport system substrate-binding protein
MRKFSPYFLLIAALAVSCNKAEPVVKVGVLASLTGNYSAYGKRAWEGVKMAVEEINAKGGINGKKLQAYIEDDMSTPQNGLAPVNKLIEIDHVPVLLAAVSGGTLTQITPLAEQGKGQVLSSVGITSSIGAKGEFSFQAQSSGTSESVQLATLGSDGLKARRFAILYVDDAYGRVSAEVFKRAVIERRGSIEFFDLFKTGRQDFSSYIESMKQHEPEIIYFVGSGAETGTFLSQLRQKGMQQVVMTSNLAGPELVDRAKKAADGVIFLSTDLSAVEKTEAPVCERDRQYKDLDTFAAEGYDMVHLAAKAINIGGSTSDGVKKGLEAIKNFEGIHGSIKLARGTERRLDRQPMTVKDGKFVPLEIK